MTAGGREGCWWCLVVTIEACGVCVRDVCGGGLWRSLRVGGGLLGWEIISHDWRPTKKKGWWLGETTPTEGKNEMTNNSNDEKTTIITPH